MTFGLERIPIRTDIGMHPGFFALAHVLDLKPVAIFRLVR
jgi:hypothetical protein